MYLLISLILNAATLIVTSSIVPGFHIADFKTAILAAIILGVINIAIRPILILITLPLNFLTLGLFTFVVNAIVLWLASQIVPGMTIDDIVTGILAAVVISIVSTILSHLQKDLGLGK